MLLILSITAFFTYDDLLYNPLASYNINHTRISLKSTYLGSYANIMLFSAKPMLVDTTRWMLIKCGCKCIASHGKKHPDNGNHNYKYFEFERMISLHRRCKIKWKTEDHSESDPSHNRKSVLIV